MGSAPTTTRKENVSNLYRSLRLLQFEALLTSILMVMPVLNRFFQEIGMNQGQIGLSQALFTVALVMLNVPTGWLADRFSRKFCNSFGDLLAGTGFLLYGTAHSFLVVVLSEIILGVGMAFSQGADDALFKAYSTELGISHASITVRLAKLLPLAEMVGVIIGGALGATHIRACFAVEASMFFVGALISLFVTELGERRVTHRSPWHDMAVIIRYSLREHRELGWTIAMSSLASNLTHPFVWMLSPMLLAAGCPVSWLGVAWACSLCAVSVGAWLAGQVQCTIRCRIVLPAVSCIVALLVLGWSVGVWTIGVYLILCLTRGWYGATMPAFIQSLTPSDIRSTVSSVAGTVRLAAYIPLVWGINALADHGFRAALWGSALVYAGATAVVVKHLDPYLRGK